MTINPTLMSALLAMDSYNRGYNARIDLNGDAAQLGLGTVTILKTVIEGQVVNLDSAIFQEPRRIDQVVKDGC